MTITLSLCIVNHRTPALLRQCLDSIVQAAAGCDLEVYVVNNTADDADEVRARVAAVPGGHFLQNAAPLGFAANQNQMLRQASGRYRLPLNSDTALQPGALAELCAFMTRTRAPPWPGRGWCAPMATCSPPAATSLPR